LSQESHCQSSFDGARRGGRFSDRCACTGLLGGKAGRTFPGRIGSGGLWSSLGDKSFSGPGELVSSTAGATTVCSVGSVAFATDEIGAGGSLVSLSSPSSQAPGTLNDRITKTQPAKLRRGRDEPGVTSILACEPRSYL
jgi:hypothetical protein